MKSTSLFSASAPGSLMLLGEHAVLHGQPALVCAINRRMTVSLETTSDNLISIQSALGSYQYKLNEEPDYPAFSFVLQAIKQHPISSGFKLTIESEFSSDIGFGSSAAVTVATHAVLMEWIEGRIPDREALFDQSLKTVLAVQGRGSGSDLAASIFGGVVEYTTAPSFNPIAISHPLTAVYCGYKMRTPEVIKHIEKLALADPTTHQQIYEKMGASVTKAAQALRDKEYISFCRILNENQELMDQLGVNTKELAEITAALQDDKMILGAKISGSGMGDCAIGFGRVSSFNLDYPTYALEITDAGVTHSKPVNLSDPKELLHRIRKSLDTLLLRDRSKLNGMMRKLRHRMRENKPVDQHLERLIQFHQDALIRVKKWAAVDLTISYPEGLPVSAKHEEICQLIKDNQVVIVCGTTGSGKTTQLPKIVRDAGYGKWGRIGVTQPRRLAATGMARRVAEEMKCDYGKGVGCQVRFDDKTSPETIIKFMTDGILLAETQHDRHLLQYDTIIIDEAHERSLNIDFLLGYLKNLMKIRPELRIVISSATLDASGFSNFFDEAPIIEIEGRTFPVEDFFFPPGKDEDLSNHILRAVREVSSIDNEGDILIFLPGEREIRDATAKLEGQRFPGTEVLPLFGRLNMSEQQRVFKPGGRRRIILATNVAETSITIPGIHYVIDSGLVRLSRYNPRTQVQGLQVEQVSQASARQRRGRCGRVADGICFYLYDEETLENSARYTDPEIRRSSLAGVILQMDLLKLPPIEQFPLIDPPQTALVREGYKTLQDIGALDEERRLTKMGRTISSFPTDPHLARMIIQAHEEGALSEILVLVAFLSIQDVRERPMEKADLADQAHGQWKDTRSDFITILNLWNFIEDEVGSGGSQGRTRRLCKKNFINYHRVMEWKNLHRDLCSIVRGLGWKVLQKNRIDDFHYDLVHRSLLAGLPTNVGTKGEEPSDAGSSSRTNKQLKSQMIGMRNRNFFIFPGSALFKKPPQWVMTFSLVETAKLYARTVAEIEPAWLEAVAPQLCKPVYSKPQWNPDLGFVYAIESIVSGGLTLIEGRRVHYGPIHPEEARKIFIREGMAVGNLKTKGGWLKLHQKMLDEITALEEKIRRPGCLLDREAVEEHFERVVPKGVYSVKELERWIRKTKARIAMKTQDAMYPQSNPVTLNDYPDEVTFFDEPFTVIYSFDPGDELDGMSIVCSSDRLILLPDWAPDWVVPGWLPEKVVRLLKTLPKNIRESCSPIEKTARQFCSSFAQKKAPLLSELSDFLQAEFKLPIDASDFDESTLPDFLKMKVIETKDDEIVHVHTDLSAEHRQTVYRNSSETAFAKWSLPPQQSWPGDSLPEFIVTADNKKTRGYPALTDEIGGVGRHVFMSQADAFASHRDGLVHLFRLKYPDQVKYVEKRPPLPPIVQMTLSTLDGDFLTDFMDGVIYDALTKDGDLEIRDAATFDERALDARSNLYEYAEDAAGVLLEMLELREKVDAALSTLPNNDSRDDIEMQLAFLFRPGFLKVPDVYACYPRFLKALKIRQQRILNNSEADLRKLSEVSKFQGQLSAALLDCDDIAAAHDLQAFAVLLEEFRVNRFAPEVRSPVKVSAQRLDKAWEELS